MRRTVMIYDGLCGLCTQSMRVVRRLDWLGRIMYLDARHWPDVHSRFPDLEQAAALGLIHVITADGRVHVGYAGVRTLIRELPLVMWLYPLLFLPGVSWLGPRVYAWVAANRLRLNWLFGAPPPCEDEFCPVHPPRRVK